MYEKNVYILNVKSNQALLKAVVIIKTYTKQFWLVINDLLLIVGNWMKH